MKQALLLVLVLLGLAFMASHSSRAPDAVQRLLHLPGGTESGLKAIVGIVVAVGAALVLGCWLARKKS